MRADVGCNLGDGRQNAGSVVLAGNLLGELDNATAQLFILDVHECLGQRNPSEVARKSDT